MTRLPFDTINDNALRDGKPSGGAAFLKDEKRDVAHLLAAVAFQQVDRSTCGNEASRISQVRHIVIEHRQAAATFDQCNLPTSVRSHPHV